MRKQILTSILLAWFAVFLTRPLFAADQPFYEGKTIRFIIASGPGGGTDTAGRLVARFLPKYLPGNPKIIVQNMPGGGGTIANNYFASEVKPDGLTIMQDSSSGVAPRRRVPAIGRISIFPLIARTCTSGLLPTNEKRPAKFMQNM